MKAIRLAVVILGAGLLLDAGANQAPQTRQKVPRFDAAAVVKLVPVRVLDAEGNPVTDLKKEEFTLFDNKERKAITEFEVHGIDPAVRGAAKTETGVAETSVPDMGRKYFIYLDFQANDVNGNENAKKAALEFVETRLLPGDEAALLYYAGMTGLNMVDYLTADLAKIKKAIERAKEMGAGQFGGTLTGGYGMIAENPAVMTGAPGRAAVVMRTEAGETAVDVEKDMNSGKISPPVVNVDIGNWQAGMVGSAVPSLGLFGRRGPDFIENMGELASALKYIPGAKTIVFFSARTTIPAELGRAFASSNTPVFVVNTQDWIEKGGVKQKYLWTEHPLRAFAETSGGRYFSDVTAVEAVSASIQSFSANYYVLGYYVNEAWDGRFHEIRVETTRPGSKVYAQAGYSNPRPFAEWSEIEKKLNLYDLAFADRPAAPTALNIPAAALSSPGAGGTTAVALAALAVDEKTGIPPGKAEVLAIVFEKGGLAVRALRATTELTTSAGRTLCFYVASPLPAGDYEFRFVARDLETGQAAVGIAALSVPKESASGVRFASPLLIIPGRETRFLKLNWPGRAADKSTLADYYPFLPKNGGPIVGPLRAGEKTILAVLAAEFPAGAAALKVDLNFRLTNAAGEEFPVVTKIVESKKIAAGRSAMALEIDLPELVPGDYILEITCADAASGPSHILKAPFTVK